MHTPKIKGIGAGLIIVLVALANPAISKSGKASQTIAVSAAESRFVIFKELSAQYDANGSITITGSFLMKGENIFGHFAAIARNDSGAIVGSAASSDSPFSRDHGPKIKTFSLTISAIRGEAAKVELSYEDARTSE